MPYGTGPLIRQALLRASPWQRHLIGVAMVGGGAVLVFLGHVAGAVLCFTGLLLLSRAPSALPDGSLPAAAPARDERLSTTR